MISKVVKKISVMIKHGLAFKINKQNAFKMTQEELENANNEAVEENLRNTYILMKMAV